MGGSEGQTGPAREQGDQEEDGGTSRQVSATTLQHFQGSCIECV